MDDLLPNSYCSEVNRRLSELHFLVWLAQQKKEERRLVIATLEALVGSSSTPKKSDSEDLAYGPHAEGSKQVTNLTEGAPSASEKTATLIARGSGYSRPW